jgi:hypothetical protein
MEYTWNIREVEVYPKFTKDGVEYTDVIHTIHWSYIAEENGDMQEHINELKLGLDDLSQFTPYNALDAATVASWVEAEIPVEDFERMRNALADSIQKRQLLSTSEVRTL